jgi:hypothetical protein
MRKAWISTASHAVTGAVLGYVVFVDDAERFVWPFWLGMVVAGTLVAVACSLVLVNGRTSLRMRAAATSTGGFAMLLAGLVGNVPALRANPPLVTALSVATLIVMCQLYFLPSWIAALLPPRRPARNVIAAAHREWNRGRDPLDFSILPP